MRKYWRYVLLSGLLSATVSACTPQTLSQVSDPAAFEAQAGKATWANLTFLNYDNDLDEGLSTVNKLHTAAKKFKSVVFATLYDGAKDKDTQTFFQSDPGEAVEASSKTEVNSASMKSVMDFVKSAKVQSPAKRQALTISDHGGGIIRGLCEDEKAPSGEDGFYADAMGEGFRKQPVDMLILDACFMNMAEIAYELIGGVNYLIAAQTTTEGEFPYQDVAATLEKTAQQATAKSASAVVDTLKKDLDYTVAIGAIDVQATQNLAKSMRALSDILIEKLPKQQKAIHQAIDGAQSYANEHESNMLLYNEYRDLIDILDRLSAIDDTAIAKAAKAARTDAEACILNHFAKSGFDLKLKKANGLGIYASTDGTVSSRYVEYKWNKDTRWGDFLIRLNKKDQWSSPLVRDKYPRAFPSKKKR